MIALEKARSCLEALGLSQASEILDSRLQKAAADGATYADFLSDILGKKSPNGISVMWKSGATGALPLQETLGSST